MAAKGPFQMPEATDAEWRTVAEATAKPDQRRPTPDEQRRGCVKGAEGY